MAGFVMKPRLRPLGLLLVSVCFALLAGGGIDAAELNVFAAASLTDVLKEIAAGFQRETADKLTFNLGASSLLARQIQEGAPADVFFSADEAKMDGLEKAGLIVRETRKRLLSNTLVIIVDKGARFRLESPRDLAGAGVKRVALAEPKTVPAGIYARSYLQKIGLWSKIVEKVIPTENVRGAMAAVEAGNADAAIVYRTDALTSKKIKIACEIPASETPEITYAVAVMKESRNLETARRLVNYFQSPAAVRAFEKYGFVVLK